METQPSLRRTLALVIALSGTLVLLLAVSLIVLTSVQSNTSRTLAEAIENVRLAREAEIDLLLMARADDPAVFRRHQTALMSKLEEAQAFVSTTEEARALADATAAVEPFQNASAHPTEAQEQKAFDALERIVQLELLEAKTAREWADRIDLLGDVFGIAACLFFVATCVVLLVWLKFRAFQPLFAFATVIEQFHAGNDAVRAREEGPEELALMAARFNAMANTLVRQRQDRLAFLAGVAHDLRNPLTAMNLALGRASHEALPPEKLRPTLEVIRRQSQRLERMVTDLLDAAQIESGRLEIRKEVRDGRELLREVYDLFQGTTTRHELKLQLPEAPAYLDADPGRMLQVLTNLVSNAIKYSPEGGEVELGMRSDGEQLTLYVRDHGMGIDPSEASRLFDPFRRSLRRQQETIPGVGLGLFVVKRIVDAHLGKIHVRSSVGAGSTFEVTLPGAGAEAKREHMQRALT